MINNRQNGRRRGRGGSGGGNNNQRQGGNQGRGDSANRIDSRARGNANQLYEKYKNLARDAQMSGDRVNIEYYLQFADHYFRVLADQRSRMENDTQPRRQQPFDINGDDDDDMVEGEPIRSGEQNGEDRDDRANGRQQNYRQQNQGRDRGDGDQPQRYARGNDRDGDRQGGQRPRRDRDDRDERDEVAGQHRSDPPANGEALDERAEQVIEADAPLAAPPRRRGRPRREEVASAPAAADAATDAGLAADRLPPSLTIGGEEGEAEPRPRRRTRRPSVEASAAE